MSSNNYCPRLHHGLVLDNISRSNLTYSACCWGNESISTEQQINFDHPDLQRLRKINLEGHMPSPHCDACITQEAAGSNSMRTGYLATHGPATTDSSLQYLDINIDYTCNLACVTCGPSLSTTWRNELGIVGRDVRPNLDQFFVNTLDQLDLSRLREVRMWGGEPLLTLTHKRILEYLCQHTDPSNIRLMYNTNGTQRIDQDTKQLIERFKFARISFSVDGVGKQFEYLRYPAVWKEVEQNLVWWRTELPHNSMLSMTVTASLLNALYLNTINDWYQANFTESKFGDPIEMYVHQAFGLYAMDAMPAKMIDHFKNIKNYCQPWIQNLATLGTGCERLDEIKQELRKNDLRRGLNLSEIMPEVADFIGYQL